MRELKFRVWDNGYGKFRDVIGFDYDQRGIRRELVKVFNDDTGYVYYCSSETIQQYTGLKDKNGNEIYEGDILDFNNRQYQVYFNECSFKVQRIDHLNRNLYLYLLEDYPTWDMEVVGNIYENPELVK